MLNYKVIVQLIKEKSKVLDMGCGSGDLAKMLVDEKKAKVIGVEINEDCVIEALQKGLSVIQANLDEGLKQFPDKSFDYAVLNQTLQSTNNPEFVIDEMLRTSKCSIVSFPNFAYWKVRFYLFFKGKMPKSKHLPYEWYNTPNIHLLTVNDFFEFCKKRDIKINEAIYLTRNKVRRGFLMKTIKNFFSEEVIFVISK